MATIEGAHSTYDEPIGTGGDREDLSDMLFDVSPTETPFITAANKNKATGVNHEWLTDKLAEPAANANVEGEDAQAAQAASRVRLGNYTQILKKHATVTGTQEKVLKGGGIKSEMAYQVARRLKEMKRDFELACVGVSNAKAAGDESTARQMASFDAYIASGYLGTGAAPAGDGTDAPSAGTGRNMTEELFKEALEQLWNQSGGNENVMALCGSHVRGVISDFNASSTRYVTTDDKKLVASIDVYDGDFHTVTVTPDRYSKAKNCFIIDAEYVAVSDLGPVNTYDLAKTGDSMRKEVVWETTLEVRDPDAHINIADLNDTNVIP